VNEDVDVDVDGAVDLSATFVVDVDKRPISARRTIAHSVEIAVKDHDNGGAHDYVVAVVSSADLSRLVDPARSDSQR
jgi:hypothetical protein